MAKKLIIVESPNKIKKIKECVGKDYEVVSSVGGFVELEKKNLGFDLDTFTPVYKIADDKKDVIKKIKEEAELADTIYIASDNDREGVGICYNILDILPKKNKKIERAVFNELSKKVILESLKNPIGFDPDMNFAQQTRRITDRMFGFKLSPMLWARGGMKGVSAGRTQSAALKILVDREREIRAFKKDEYWSIKTLFDNGLSAELSFINKKEVSLPNEASAEAIRSDLEKCKYSVSAYGTRSRTRDPYPPFMTASMQIEASSKFGWAAKKTMENAQKLFEMGLVTYIRTDSERIDPEKIAYIREKIKDQFGEEYLSKEPRQFLAKDGAQDAHECIRPTFEPEPSLTSDQSKLLRLIENRFMASQMAPAVFDQVSVKIAASNKDTYELKANGSVMSFDGFIKIYGADAKDLLLPSMSKGDVLLLKEAAKTQHFTKPPARFNDASMVSLLKDKGIGRPSTYVTIPQMLLDRNYIEKEKNSFKVTELGIMVSDYLFSHFPDLIDVGFTAKMEEKLDLIALGKLKKNDVLSEFYTKLLADIEVAKTSGSDEFLKTGISCKKCSGEMIKKASNFKVFIGCSSYPNCGYTVNYGDNGELIESEVETGHACPLCSNILLKKSGKFGAYYLCSSGKEVCSYTASVGADGMPVEKKKAEVTEHKCPNCETGYMVLRKSKFEKHFLGCSGYPKCKTILNVAEDGSLTESKPSTKKFTKKGEDTGRTCPTCKKGNVLIMPGKWGPFESCSEYKNGCKYSKKIKE